MAEVTQLDYILSDCFLAVGQAVGTNKAVDFEVVTWWHRRYRPAFDDAVTSRGASWVADRDRVTAVGRYLGQRAVHYSGGDTVIGRTAAARASDEVERGCQMNATRDELSRPSAPTRPSLRFESVADNAERARGSNFGEGNDAGKNT